ncbi:hypothetical protein PYW07_004857 [Mythimna separata]|uniref:Calpain catalytic domain-containing protein n=1 Tax=Mythimna separata TaxID=271217 RepID=A0AAD7YEG4_MYTSE|nr:hypothetical protein PYW07_004857 [Mythimna separata]
MRKFMRTRARSPSPPPPPADTARVAPANGHAHINNGHANGAALRDDRLSELSRCWSGSEASGALFEDGAFPPARALGDARLARAAAWLRPHELCARPRFRGDDGADDAPDQLADRWNVQLGAAGDPHLCCAAAALAPTPRLLDRAAPPQSFRKRYTGAFRFRFWVFGEWREVLVDDRLPAAGARLLAAPPRHDDFTLPLLEKAYAKLHGSYAALRGGSVARALQELSGGIVQSFSLRAQPRALTFQVLNSAVPRSTLLVAVAARGAPGGLQAAAPYAVAGLARVRGGAGAGALVRLRAPGGRGAWRGAWAPDSAEWRALAPPDRDLLAPRADRPGDFWMSFEDFAASFSQLELVHVGPDDWLLERGLHARRPWRAVLARRRWRAGYNAGGPPAAATTAANPQFHVQIPCSEAAGARKCHVVVSVTQQYDVGAAARKLRAIGFAVYELGPGGPRRPSDPAALRGLRPLDVTHESRAREVVTFFTLPPGRYLVVPHTRRAHTDAAFLLRILTDELTDVWEVNDDNVVVRDVAAELRADALPAGVRAAAARLRAAPELDAAALRAALRRVWRVCLCARPSLELCRALVPLRDAALSGAMRASELPALLALLAYWRAAFLKHGGRRCGAVSSYRLRALLWAAGVTASNKVLECLVLRYARGCKLTEEAYVMALARLHLAHERYRSLDTKMKSNPLSLEEMILMTIYS